MDSDDRKKKKEAKKKDEAINAAILLPILNAFKAKWRASRTSMKEKRKEDYSAKENSEIWKKNEELESRNSELTKRNEYLEIRIAETEQKLEVQKLLAAKRLEVQQYQTSLKMKEKARGEKRKFEVEKAKEGIHKQKSARLEEEKKKKDALERAKKAKSARLEEEKKKKDALERAKKAESALKEVKTVMQKLNQEWKKKTVEIGNIYEIMLPENPFRGLKEEEWIQAATEAAPKSAREQIAKLIQMGRKRLPPDMEISKVDAALMVYLYTTHAFYADYSRCYRDDTASKEQYKRIHYMILCGLKNRKLTKGSYWRGMSLDPECKLCLTMFAALADNCRGEHTFSLLTPQSASKQIGTAAAFGSGTATSGKVQVICCFEGAAVDVKEISAYPWEDECVLPPGLAKFLSVCKVGEKYFCHVMMK
jgi:hypothetical protein